MDSRILPETRGAMRERRRMSGAATLASGRFVLHVRQNVRKHPQDARWRRDE
jgi:hypothetical protein